MRDTPRRSRNNRRPQQGGGGPRPPQQGGGGGPRPPQQGGGNRPPQGGQSGRPGSGRRRRRRSYRPLSAAQVIQKYMNLLDQHMSNRRKYFEYFNREDGRHRKRLERNFFSSVEQLRKFEEKLEPRQKDILKQHVNRYRLDLTYSSNHELPTEAEIVAHDGNFDDPHFTAAQQAAFEEYADDREESVGTMDDYVAYRATK